MYMRTVEISVDESIKLPVQGLPPLLEKKINDRLVFTNPEYQLRHNSGDWLGGIQPQISCLRKTGRHYVLPRGFLAQLLELSNKHNQPYRLVDNRRSFEPIPIEFHGQLKDYQQEAAEAVLERDFATLVGGHKSGKTVIALFTVAQRRQPTLILVPRSDLIPGWLEKIESFLQIPPEEVGRFVDGKKHFGKAITIAHTAEMMRHWRRVRDRIGYVILDDCERCPAKVFTHLMTNFDSRYMLGLASSTQRKDRLSRYIYYYVGDVVYAINERDAKEGRGVIQAKVIARTTDFDYPYRSRDDYRPMLQALMEDEERTRLIASDVEAEWRQSDERIMILSGGNEQSHALVEELNRRGVPVVQYTAQAAQMSHFPDEEEESLVSAAEDDNQAGPVLVVTPQVLLQSGSRLSAKVLFLAAPVYFQRRLAHAVRALPFGNDDYEDNIGNLIVDPHMGGYGNDNGNGRLKIYDYVDQNVGLLDNYFRMRSYNYGVHPETLLRNSN